MTHPFLDRAARPPVEGPFSAEELGLASRNVGMPLEALRYDLTPVGMHYTLSHFDVPAVRDDAFALVVGGEVQRSLKLSMEELRALPARALRVTLECAGNGRAGMSPRYPSMPWIHGAVGTADWTGVPLSAVLEKAGLKPGQGEIAFIGADRGFDAGVEHDYGRSLSRAEALRDDVLLAWAMNGQPLLPQHGAPLRLVVPGWYGMASVKWLVRIEVLAGAYDGFQQVVGYHYRKVKGEKGVPIRHMKVRSLMVPPGMPDYFTRRRLVERGSHVIFGRAWAGEGVEVRRVELAVDGAWRDAELDPWEKGFAWRAWRCAWHAEPGEHVLACRATDALGNVQPMQPDWNLAGMGNNAVQSVAATVR
jgi:DMSO/TMAO reductase YedYZ molybdopterin-dependent catalytic subunit